MGGGDGEGATEFHDYEGGGIGEGEGVKDVSDKIENEDQVFSMANTGGTMSITIWGHGTIYCDTIRKAIYSIIVYTIIFLVFCHDTTICIQPEEKSFYYLIGKVGSAISFYQKKPKLNGSFGCHRECREKHKTHLKQEVAL